LTDQSERMQNISENMKKIKNKILVMSGKGGVGKSTVAVNLAVSLTYQGFKTGLLDIDLHGPNVVKMLGINKKLGISENGKISPVEIPGELKVVSLASYVDQGDPVIWRGPMKTTAIYQFLGDVQWGDLDFLIIDSPPGTGDESLTILQTIPDLQALIVTTPQEVALVDVRRAINFVKKMMRKPIGIVENMSYLICDKCGNKMNIFGEGGGKRVAEEFDLPLLGQLPLNPEVNVKADKGESIIVGMRDTEMERAFNDLTSNILQRVEL